MSADSTTTVPEFVSRHIGPREDDVTRMLEVIGQPSVEELIARTAPAAILGGPSLALEGAPTEQAVTDELRAIADRNQVKTSLIGLGYYGTVTPPVVRRNVLENPAWYTAYTPYQPEISQGRLEALLNFQTMVNDLTGLDIANSSLLDEGTAAAEAMTLMRRSSKAAKDAVLLVDEQVLPQSYAVIASRALPLGIQVERLDLSSVTTAEGLLEASGGKGVFGVLVQYPGADGEVRDWRALAEAAHEAKALVTAATDLLALTLLTPPGEWGADIAVGNSQRFGVPMGFGGPHAGFMSVRKGLERSMPGRLVGVSVDEVGAPAYRLALQTREQHIRREKATSNICTAQVLLAVMASMYAVWHGPEGLRRIAERVQRHTAAARQALVAASVDVRTQHQFDTLTVSVPGRADAVMAAALERDLNLWRVDADTVQLSFDETTDRAQVAAVVESFGASFSGAVPGDLAPSWPEALTRTSDYLTHPVFSAHHSETAMMRYLRRLADKDYALDRGMIPLGSCTMKLNATTELEPITWPEFSSLHPFVPTDQSAGSRQIVSDLQQWLVEITGYDAVSMQPNSGASGELAGLMAIRAYHRANGQEERNVCLIPSSAHGTNAASAVMAGFKVVVVKSTAAGSVDMEDLRGKVKEHCEVLAAIMVTYPSTHGVYEDTIVELCELVHEAGGQVYVDGANMNALVGVARPGKFGADVSHLNLHKTFCIPHGGGGPGVGPIGVRSHLAPYLPNHPLAPEAGPDTATGPAASAPYGSASILPISWAYIRLMGGEGLRRATLAAVLNANYVAARLRDHYPVLYSQDGLVAHECILDLRGITHDTGVTVDDVAKRLIDYGFHAPTMSFPVAGTLMVEPTESEDLVELDRFCDAMIAIKTEIDQVGSGEVAADASVLRHAPYTAESLAGDWDYGFDRRTAAFPAGVDPRSKYWPSVRRIDGAYGDRNLICTCPPPEAFADND